MEKKNTLILTIVAIATLLVAVIGATFAFFTAQGNNNINTAAFTANSEGGTSSFSGLFNKTDVGFDIALTEMLENASATTPDSTGKIDNVGLNVTLISANANTTTTCTFNVVYTWNGTKNTYSGGSYYYKKSSGLASTDKEFTYQVTGSSNVGETQFADAGTAAVTLLSGASISTNNATTGISKNYTFTFRFYNFGNKNQNDQKGKKFSGQLSLTNPVCTYA